MSLISAFRSRIHNAHPDHHAIAWGMAWVALFVLLGSVARAAKEVAVAYRYGVSAEVDAYLFVFNLVTWPVSVWFSVLTVVLVPLAARIRQGAAAELPRFRSELLGIALMLGLIMGLIGWLGLPLLLRASWIGLSSDTVTMAVNMSPVLSLLLPLGVIISLFSAWMLAAGRHANTLLEGIPALVVLLAILVFTDGGLAPLVWGTLVGFAFHLASLAASLVRRSEIEAPRFTRHSPQWTPFWQGFGIMLAGQILMSFVGIIDQFFAAHMGTGAIATLSYANRILALILGMGAMAVSRATLPVFSRAMAQGEEQVYRVAIHWVWLLFALGVVTMIVGWSLAPWGVRLLFERGAFASQDTVIVAEVLRYGLVQLPFYFAGLVLVSLLVSRGEYRAIAVIAGLNLLTKVVFNFGLVTWLGLKGLLLATGFMYLISITLCWVAVRRINSGIQN